MPRRVAFAIWAGFVLTAPVAAQSLETGREAVAELLTKTKSWTVYIEHGGGDVPTSRAGVGRWEFVRRGSEIVGRTLHLAPGLNGEFQVVVRDNGFDYRRCCGYPANYPLTSINYHPEDKKYPFKRTDAPQKVWLSPQD